MGALPTVLAVLATLTVRTNDVRVEDEAVLVVVGEDEAAASLRLALGLQNHASEAAGIREALGVAVNSGAAAVAALLTAVGETRAALLAVCVACAAAAASLGFAVALPVADGAMETPGGWDELLKEVLVRLLLAEPDWLAGALVLGHADTEAAAELLGVTDGTASCGH